MPFTRERLGTVDQSFARNAGTGRPFATRKSTIGLITARIDGRMLNRCRQASSFGDELSSGAPIRSP